MRNDTVKEIFNQLLIILESEKAALIHSESQKIKKLVSKKEELVKAFDSINIKEIDQADDEVISLIAEIKDYQETNLLLTKQAMNYTDTFITAFQKEANKKVTYSKTGKNNTSKSSILNQSL